MPLFNPWEPTWQAAALVPNIVYGDGRAEDHGSLHHVGNALNHFNNTKSSNAAPAPIPASTPSLAYTGEYRLFLVYPIYLSMEQLTSAITRKLRVQPHFRSTDGSSVSVRVTVARSLPTFRPSVTPSDTHSELIFTGESSRATWTTTSTSMTTGTEAELDLSVKHLQYGYLFLTVELSSDKCEFQGLPLCQENSKEII